MWFDVYTIYINEYKLHCKTKVTQMRVAPTKYFKYPDGETLISSIKGTYKLGINQLLNIYQSVLKMCTMLIVT